MIKVRARKTGAIPLPTVPVFLLLRFNARQSILFLSPLTMLAHIRATNKLKSLKVKVGGKMGPGHSPVPHTRARLSCSFLTCARIELGGAADAAPLFPFTSSLPSSGNGGLALLSGVPTKCMPWAPVSERLWSLSYLTQ